MKQFKDYYAKNVLKKAEALGVELRGLAVANSEWRIYQKLWSEELNADDKEYVIKTHLHKAMTESSRSEGEGWIVKGVMVNWNGHQIPPRTYGTMKNAFWRTKISTTSASTITNKFMEMDSS